MTITICDSCGNDIADFEHAHTDADYCAECATKECRECAADYAEEWSLAAVSEGCFP